MNLCSAPRPGVFVAVVGASGSGKDTLIRIARERLKGEPRVQFARRIVTRPADGNEDHETLSQSEFDARLAEGGFALHWQAHGLSYGLPISVLHQLACGQVVVANVSRALQFEIVLRFPRHLFVEVTANEAVRAARVSARNRSSDGSLEERLNRHVDFRRTEKTVTIENNGAADIAGKRLIQTIRGYLEQR